MKQNSIIAAAISKIHARILKTVWYSHIHVYSNLENEQEFVHFRGCHERGYKNTKRFLVGAHEFSKLQQELLNFFM